MNTKPILFIALLVLASCNRPEQTISGPLKQRGYVWQREWTPAVADAAAEATRRMDGLILLGAELTLTGKKPEIVKASIDWNTVKAQTKHCSIALRVAPYPGPFRSDGGAAETIANVARELIADAREHNVTLEEFQFDFDCAQKNLNGYRTWLKMLRPLVRPMHFVITTLPAWLDDPDFRQLIEEADGYVLQVHSVPISNRSEATLCNTRVAREWVRKAAKLQRPFSVALPTYRCSAGYGADGKLLSVAMDSVQPSWPPGTGILDFTTDADDMADLVADWQRTRPAQLRELIWYRVPVATDTRNWRWITLSAAMAGRRPEHKLKVVQEGENPIDLAIFNSGEAEEEMRGNITATWKTAELSASDALPGWRVRPEKDRAIFSVTSSNGLRLAPGANRKIGWLRFEQPTNLETQLSNYSESHR